jgi:hypothetical protein
LCSFSAWLSVFFFTVQVPFIQQQVVVFGWSMMIATVWLLHLLAPFLELVVSFGVPSMS